METHKVAFRIVLNGTFPVQAESVEAAVEKFNDTDIERVLVDLALLGPAWFDFDSESWKTDT